MGFFFVFLFFYGLSLLHYTFRITNALVSAKAMKYFMQVIFTTIFKNMPKADVNSRGGEGDG